MNVCSLQELIIRLFLGQETLGEGVRDLGRLFHDVTKISRQLRRALGSLSAFSLLIGRVIVVSM